MEIIKPNREAPLISYGNIPAGTCFYLAGLNRDQTILWMKGDKGDVNLSTGHICYGESNDELMRVANAHVVVE